MMSNELDRLMMQVHGVWHRRWLILAITAVISLVGWSVVIITPDRYEVTAKVYLDTQSMLGPLLQGLAADSNVTEQTAQVLRRTLLSRPFLEKVARSTDMDLLARTPEEFDRILLDLSKKLSVTQEHKERIYIIKYQNKDSQLAKKVVESLLNLFVEGALGASRKDTSTTQRFLAEQISEYEKKLEAAETALKDFKRKNAGLMPDEGRNYYSQLNGALEAVRVSTLALDEAKKKRNELANQVREVERNMAEEPSSEVSQQQLSPLDERIRSAQQKLDELMVRYTDEHPDIVSLRRILAELEAQKAKQRDEDSLPGRHSGQLVTNPVYQELKVALGKAEAEVAALDVRVVQSKDRVEYLRHMIDTIPTVEAELAKLNRDYDVLQENYHQLVQRREAARLSQEAELSADDVQFTVVEPPRVPLVPVSPNRPVFYAIVLIAGLGIGVGFVWVLMQLKPTFGYVSQLTAALGYPVFGTVTLVLSPQQKRRRITELVTFAMGASVLLAAFLSLQMAEILGIHLRTVLMG